MTLFALLLQKSVSAQICDNDMAVANYIWLNILHPLYLQVCAYCYSFLVYESCVRPLFSGAVWCLFEFAIILLRKKKLVA